MHKPKSLIRIIDTGTGKTLEEDRRVVKRRRGDVYYVQIRKCDVEVKPAGDGTYVARMDDYERLWAMEHGLEVASE